MTLSERAAQLRERQARVRAMLSTAAEAATMRAVETATDETPMGRDDLRGTNTRTGHMKQDWSAASRTAPVWRGNEAVTELNNNMEYASYVNDGHRMDRHFVPGLYVDNGMLNYDPSADVGIVVGTKTAYVPGVHMVDKAKETYQRVVRSESENIAEEALK